MYFWCLRWFWRKTGKNSNKIHKFRIYIAPGDYIRVHLSFTADLGRRGGGDYIRRGYIQGGHGALQYDKFLWWKFRFQQSRRVYGRSCGFISRTNPVWTWAVWPRSGFNFWFEESSILITVHTSYNIDGSGGTQDCFFQECLCIIRELKSIGSVLWTAITLRLYRSIISSES